MTEMSFYAYPRKGDTVTDSSWEDPPEFADMSEADKRQGMIIAYGQYHANRIANQVDPEVDEPIEEELPVNREVYNEHYFFVRAVLHCARIVAEAILIIGLAWFFYYVATLFRSSQLLMYAGLGATMVSLVMLWLTARTIRIAVTARLRVDMAALNFEIPRFILLGIRGNGTRLPLLELEVDEYSPSFFNFIPGWNSWQVKLRTQAQDRRKDRVVNFVKDGNRFVQMITPGLAPIQRSRFTFRRRA
jgi:hypothetical protein